MKTIDKKNIIEFEKACRKWLIQNSNKSGLNTQLENVIISKVEYSGVGFFINYKVIDDGTSIMDMSKDENTYQINGPDFVTSSSSSECGVVLFFKNDEPLMMEIFTYGDKIEDHIDDFKFI